MPLSVSQIKTIKSYQQKKVRQEEQIFVAETPKIVETLLSSSIELIAIYATPSYYSNLLKLFPDKSDLFFDITDKELERISGLSTPQSVIGIWKRPIYDISNTNPFLGLSLLLDKIQDPGNLGTIIRIADWFGIDRIICSLDSADAFQPKCLQSSMGAIAQIPIFYTNIKDLAQHTPQNFPVYGTFLDGKNIYSSSLENSNAWYIIGNEANGISMDIESIISERLYIPAFTPSSFKDRVHGSESLNAAVATGILCALIRVPK